MREKILQHKTLLALSLFGLVMMISTATIVFLYYPTATKNTDIPAVLAEETDHTLETPPEDLQKLTVLLLGYGGPGHQGGYLTDVIQLAHINFETEHITLISIPRDLWVELPNGTTAKVNRAFTLGEDPNKPVESGGQTAKQMVTTITGLEVDYFIAVDFVGFKRAIGENLGGIEVKVTKTLDDPWYPITGKELDPCGMTPEEIAEITAQYSGFELERQFPCRYEHLHYEPGLVQMEGGDALKFVRSRHGSAGGDFSRSNRQQAVLKGIRNKLFSMRALENIPELFAEITNNVTTDLDSKILQHLAPALRLTQDYTVSSVVLSTDNVLTTTQSNTGQFVLTPKAGENNWQELQQFIQTQL